MPDRFLRAPTRRTAPTIQHIKSPLTRVGYGLSTGQSYLVVLQSGRLDLRPKGDEAKHLADGPRILWQPDGGGNELLAEGGTRATLLALPAVTVGSALPATPMGEQMARTFRQTLSLRYEQDDDRIAPLLDGLATERAANDAGAEFAETHYIALLLVQLWRMARADLIAHGRAPQGLAERFVTLAGQRLRDHLKVGDYAAMLGVSRDRLGTAVQRATGVSPQGYLHQLLIREARGLLANTGMPVGQVAFRLGFADPAYFTRFFTRLTGNTPARFRKEAKAKIASGDQNFAAWP